MRIITARILLSYGAPVTWCCMYRTKPCMSRARDIHPCLCSRKQNFMRAHARTSRSSTHCNSLEEACDQSATVLANSQSWNCAGVFDRSQLAFSQIPSDTANLFLLIPPSPPFHLRHVVYRFVYCRFQPAQVALFPPVIPTRYSHPLFPPAQCVTLQVWSDCDHSWWTLN